MRQSQLRRITGTIAYRMAAIFGFQKEHATPGGVVLSSVANQVHHAAFTLTLTLTFGLRDPKP